MDVDIDADTIRMCDILSMYDLTQHVSVPMHRSGHTLDLIITRYNRALLLSNPAADCMVSNHMFVLYRVNIEMIARTLELDYIFGNTHTH